MQPFAAYTAAAGVLHVYLQRGSQPAVFRSARSSLLFYPIRRTFATLGGGKPLREPWNFSQMRGERSNFVQILTLRRDGSKWHKHFTIIIQVRVYFNTIEEYSIE